jgi:mannose-6-phosphate isomerase-like protein (cupin superfamily)
MNLQVASMNHPEGHVIQPHVHLNVERTILGTSEVLIVRSGKMRAHMFSEMEVHVESVTVKAGDVLLLVSGGHSFEILEESSFIEVKQGPFHAAADKRRFEASLPHLKDDVG